MKSVLLPERQTSEDANDLQARQIEEIVRLLRRLGPAGPRFQRRMEEVDSHLKTTDHNIFDQGLVELGELLGFTTWKPQGEAPPDAVWQLGYDLLFIFEGKSNEAPGDGISVQNCRQTSGHLNWGKAQDDFKDIKASYSILVSPKSSIDEEAIPYSDSVYYLAISDTLRLFETIESALIESRGIMTTTNTDELGDRVLQILTQKGLTSEGIRTLLTSKLIKDLEVHKNGE